MPFRMVVLTAALGILGIACTSTVSTEAFARVPTGTPRLHHYHRHGTVLHSGQIRWVKPPATVGLGVSSPYCWPYDYSYEPQHYCGASYIPQ
jgi:hypothetical protein